MNLDAITYGYFPLYISSYWAAHPPFYPGLEVRGWAVLFERYYMVTRVLIVQTWLSDLSEWDDCAPSVIRCLCKAPSINFMLSKFFGTLAF